MNPWVPLGFSEARQAEAQNLGLFTENCTALFKGDKFSFTILHNKEDITVRGTVIEVSYTAHHPLAVQYEVPGYGRRIEWFDPRSLMDVQKERE